VFQYQKSLALGEPVDERPLPVLWCVVPAALLVVLYGLFASATYHPRATGTASRGAGPDIIVLSIAAPGREFVDLQAGDAATIRIGDGAPHRMIVQRTRAAACAASRRCVEIEARIDGRIDGPADPSAIPAGASAPAEVLLAARAVVR
jgi:hypothetical protein